VYYLFGKPYKNLKQVYETGLSLVCLGTLYSRINTGWKLIDAVSTPANEHPKALSLRILQLKLTNLYNNKQIAEIVGTNPKLVDNELAKLPKGN
jgi:hypothetical protein